MEQKISVIVNFHNSEKYIEYCLKSILKQDYKNLEIIMWDNHSDDKSYKIIKKFKDHRIKYFYNKKRETLYKARNLAIQHSTGNFIAFLDSDDWWEYNFISSRINFFNRSEFLYFYSNVYLFNEKTKKKRVYKDYLLPDGKLYNFLSKDYFIIISAVIFRREVFEKFGMFNENYNIIGDYEYFMRISKVCSAKSINSPMLNYRVHDNNLSKTNIHIFFQEYKDWFEKQLEQKDRDFLQNIFFFKKNLLLLETRNLLMNSKKNFYLLKKIFKLQGFLTKAKYLLVFLIPRKFYKYFK